MLIICDCTYVIGKECVTSQEFIRNTSFMGIKVGLNDIKNQLSFIQIRKKNHLI